MRVCIEVKTSLVVTFIKKNTKVVSPLFDASVFRILEILTYEQTFLYVVQDELLEPFIYTLYFS